MKAWYENVYTDIVLYILCIMYMIFTCQYLHIIYYINIVSELIYLGIIFFKYEKHTVRYIM